MIVPEARLADWKWGIFSVIFERNKKLDTGLNSQIMDAYKLFQNNIGFGRPIFMCSGILSSCKDKLTILVIEGISSSKHKLV
jgi:hypothetical protein